MNRTGNASSPVDSKKMLENVDPNVSTAPRIEKSESQPGEVHIRRTPHQLDLFRPRQRKGRDHNRGSDVDGKESCCIHQQARRKACV